MQPPPSPLSPGSPSGAAAEPYADFPPASDRQFLRHCLLTLKDLAPGGSVEVRVVPIAAIQCIAGVRHTRGTPPNVVEMSAATWHGLLTNTITWDQGLSSGLIDASGSRADISHLLEDLRSQLQREQTTQKDT